MGETEPQPDKGQDHIMAQRTKKDFTTTCHFVGCKCKATHKLIHNWGTKPAYSLSCNEHTPDWAKTGAKQSPPAEIFGQTKSWYTIEVL